MRASATIKATKIVSLIDGKEYAALRGQLAQYGITAEEYREMFGLPSSYPMLHPHESAAQDIIQTKTNASVMKNVYHAKHFIDKIRGIKARAKAEISKIKADLKDVAISAKTIREAKKSLGII